MVCLLDISCHQRVSSELVSVPDLFFQRGGLMRFFSRLGMIFLFLPLLGFAQPAENSSPPLLVANDNRTAAGQLTNGVLNLHLELRNARWYPEDEKAGYRDVYAFAEQGRPPQSSGPLIRCRKEPISTLRFATCYLRRPKSTDCTAIPEIRMMR